MLGLRAWGAPRAATAVVAVASENIFTTGKDYRQRKSLIVFVIQIKQSSILYFVNIRLVWWRGFLCFFFVG